MTSATPNKATPVYPSREAAGAAVGGKLTSRIQAPAFVWGVTPAGVEIAARVAAVFSCGFDVVVGAEIDAGASGVVGALVEDADATYDPSFTPGFGEIDVLGEALEGARRAVRTDRLAFRGQRVLGNIEGNTLVIIDGHVTSAWKLIAAAKAAESMRPQRIVLAAAVATKSVRVQIAQYRFEFVCPHFVTSPDGHPLPFGDSQDSNAERLRGIVVARQAA